MDFLIRRTDNPDYYDLKYFDTLQELLEYRDALDCQIRISRNAFRDPAFIVRYCPASWADDAYDIAHCPYEIIISEWYSAL